MAPELRTVERRPIVMEIEDPEGEAVLTAETPAALARIAAKIAAIAGLQSSQPAGIAAGGIGQAVQAVLVALRKHAMNKTTRRQLSSITRNGLDRIVIRGYLEHRTIPQMLEILKADHAFKGSMSSLGRFWEVLNQIEEAQVMGV